MLTLDQVRAVNGGFGSGDLNAALRPLEETIDLRSNELPRLDKAALARLKADLSRGEVAGIWAEAILHPNVSVRRFARKVFMGMGDEAAPLAPPLQKRIERFWSEETPLDFSNKPREAAARREQSETLNSALELLLRANPEAFMAFWEQLLDASQSRKTETAQETQEWRERATKASQAVQAEVERLLREEWGQEWVASDQRWKLPSRILREINERALSDAEVARLQSEIGEAPWQRAALQWQPAQLFAGAVGSYLSEVEPTAPTRRVAERVRPILRGWIVGAFDDSKSIEERPVLAQRINNSTQSYSLGTWLGEDWTMETLPTVLIAAKSKLLDDINRALDSERFMFGFTSARETSVSPLSALWIGLMQTFGYTLHLRSPLHGRTTKTLPVHLPPQLLKDVVEGLKDPRNSHHLISSIRQVASKIEKKGVYEPKPAKPLVAKPEEPAVRPHELLGQNLLRQIYTEQGYTEEAEARIAAEAKKAEEEMALPDDDEQVRLLVEPPQRIRGPKHINPNPMISRLPYWNVWLRQMGNDAEELKARVWSRAAPQLWARYEEKLEAYRRAETDPVEEKVERKLTERELKAWKADRRREKRGLIAQEIRDISAMLIRVEGFPAQLRAIELADRPSCRDIRDGLENGLFYLLDLSPGQGNKLGGVQSWDVWKLGPEWDAILRKLETRFTEAKEGWQREALARQLASGFYRRDNFSQFAHYAVQGELAFPQSVAQAISFYDDFEAWKVLLGSTSRWASAQGDAFWQEQLKEPSKRARAIQTVLEILSSTSNDGAAKTLLGWVAPLPAPELESHVATIERALESSLVPVKRWAMNTLLSLPHAGWNRERAVEIAGEALWNENTGLVKDAAKFLSELAKTGEEHAPQAWELLCDATALDNLTLSEAVWKALAQIQAKNKSLELSDAARARLEELVGAQSDRFGKFSKKFALSAS